MAQTGLHRSVIETNLYRGEAFDVIIWISSFSLRNVSSCPDSFVTNNDRSPFLEKIVTKTSAFCLWLRDDKEILNRWPFVWHSSVACQMSEETFCVRITYQWRVRCSWDRQRSESICRMNRWNVVMKILLENVEETSLLWRIQMREPLTRQAWATANHSPTPQSPSVKLGSVFECVALHTPGPSPTKQKNQKVLWTGTVMFLFPSFVKPHVALLVAHHMRHRSKENHSFLIQHACNTRMRIKIHVKITLDELRHCCFAHFHVWNQTISLHSVDSARQMYLPMS